jgi:hypothetical protein
MIIRKSYEKVYCKASLSFFLLSHKEFWSKLTIKCHTELKKNIFYSKRQKKTEKQNKHLTWNMLLKTKPESSKISLS